MREVFFRTILFKLFNKIETWELLSSKLGTPAYSTFSIANYDKILSRAIESNRRIYSAAYIMPSGNKTFRTSRKHRAHLRLLDLMMKDDLPLRISDATSMRQTFEMLISYPMIGEFLAYQFATDINYSNLTNFNEMAFVVPGPGAIDGIHKCFTSLGGLTESEIIRVVADRQEIEFERLGLQFKSLWGRPLQLVDCQNLFCEVGKYARVCHPKVLGKSGRTRIKQKYRSNPQVVAHWYPPKWKLNDNIAAMRGEN